MLPDSAVIAPPPGAKRRALRTALVGAALLIAINLAWWPWLLDRSEAEPTCSAQFSYVGDGDPVPVDCQPGSEAPLPVDDRCPPSAAPDECVTWYRLDPDHLWRLVRGPRWLYDQQPQYDGEADPPLGSVRLVDG